MIIPNIWENKKCSKPPTSLSVTFPLIWALFFQSYTSQSSNHRVPSWPTIFSAWLGKWQLQMGWPWTLATTSTREIRGFLMYEFIGRKSWITSHDLYTCQLGYYVYIYIYIISLWLRWIYRLIRDNYSRGIYEWYVDGDIISNSHQWEFNPKGCHWWIFRWKTGTVWARYWVFVVPHSRFGRSEAIKSIPMRLCHLKEVGNRWYINGDHGIPTRCRVGICRNLHGSELGPSVWLHVSRGNHGHTKRWWIN